VSINDGAMALTFFFSPGGVRCPWPSLQALLGAPSSRLRFYRRPFVSTFENILGHDTLETGERSFARRERKKRSVVRAGAAVETRPVVARSSAGSSRCTVPTPLAL